MHQCAFLYPAKKTHTACSIRSIELEYENTERLVIKVGHCLNTLSNAIQLL